jgi:hypothetical protein
VAAADSSRAACVARAAARATRFARTVRRREWEWIAVAPGADLGAARTRIGSGSEWHWLAPGFPRIDANAAPSATPTASLLRELDARMPAGSVLRVVVPETLGGLDGERAHLAHALDWIVVPGQSPSAPDAAREPVVLHVRYADDEATRSRTCAASSRRGTCASRTATRSTRSP